MNRKQLILVVTGFLLTIVLFALRKDPDQVDPLERLSNKGKSQLESGKLTTIEELEVKAHQANDTERPDALLNLAEAWNEAGNSGMAALITFKAAEETESDANLWMMAGESSLEALAKPSEDENLNSFLQAASSKSFEKVLALKPGDIEAGMKLAEIYINFQGAVMKGVMLLREITTRNPDHIEANLMLGRLSIESGQYENAITRLNNVLEKDSANVSALIYLGTAYQSMGEAEKAVEFYTRALQTTDDSLLKTELEKRIQEIKI